MIQIRMFQGRSGFEAIAPAWNTVCDSLPIKRFFHLCEWYESYIDALETHPDNLHFFVAYRGNAPVAIFPLRATSRRVGGIGIRFLELPKHPHMNLADVLCISGVSCRDVLRSLIGFLRGQTELEWDVMSFSKLLEESALNRIGWFTQAGVRKQVVGTSDFFVCERGYEEISARFSKNFRATLRKAHNRLEAHARVEFRSVTDRHALPEALGEFVALEASGWKGTGGTGSAIKLHPELVRFYERLVDRFSLVGGCRINFLVLDGQTIAGQFCLISADAIYILKIAYDERYARYSPGQLLLEHVLSSANGESSTAIVSLVTDTKWHSNWRPHAQKVLNVSVYNRSVRGLALLAAVSIIQLLHSLSDILADWDLG